MDRYTRFWKVRLGEHGRHGAGKSSSAPRTQQSRATKADTGRSRRWGPLTAETAIVLSVAAAIVGGAFLMNNLRPGDNTTRINYGKDTVIEHQLGEGGIKPGALQPRTIVPPKPAAAVTTAPTLAPTTTPKPTKTPKPVATVAPTQPTSGGNLPIPGGGGSGGGGETCTPIPLIKTCPDKPVESPAPSTPAEPEPEATATAGPGETDEDATEVEASDGVDGTSAAQKKADRQPAGR